MIEGGLGPADEMGMDELVPQHPAAVPRCDDGGVYTLNSLGEPSTCSSTAFSPLNRYMTALETLERPARQ